MAEYHPVLIFHFPKLHRCAQFCALDLSSKLCFWFKFCFRKLFSSNLGDGLLSLLPHCVELLLAGLQQESNPVGVVVHGEVGQPGAGVGVHADLVALLQAQQDGGAGHGVLVVVLVVLVEDGGNLIAIEADGEQGLLVVGRHRSRRRGACRPRT